MAINKFYLDGKSSREMGILINSPKPYGSPSLDVNEVTVPGRSGNLFIFNERYENYELTYPCGIMKNVDEKMRKIKAWLYGNRDYRKLYDDYVDGYFRLAAFNSQIDVERDGDTATFELKFNCKPWLYSFEGERIVEMVSGTIFNPEAFESRPILEVYGSGDITVKINNSSIEINNVSEYITIDTDTLNAYKDTANQNGNVIGIDVGFAPGENNIVVYGNCTNIKIKPRWRTI